MRRAALIAAAAFLFAACQREEPKLQPKDPLDELTSQIINTRPCSVTIPGEWAPSLPVPALQDGKLVYKIFYAGWEGNPKKGIKDHGAEGDATFTPDGTILSCARRGNEPRKFPIHASRGVTEEQWDRMERAVFEQTRRIAALYAAGKSDREAAAQYSAAFAAVAQLPEEAADYRALSPEFWAWLEANGGRGPKP